MTAWAATGRPVAEFWSLTLREIGLVMQGHAQARQHDLELAYYTAWHAGLFSQAYKPGKFPDYQKNAPRPRKRGSGRRMTAEQMKAQALAIVAAMGGTIRKRGD